MAPPRHLLDLPEEILRIILKFHFRGIHIKINTISHGIQQVLQRADLQTPRPISQQWLGVALSTKSLSSSAMSTLFEYATFHCVSYEHLLHIDTPLYIPQIRQIQRFAADLDTIDTLCHLNKPRRIFAKLGHIILKDTISFYNAASGHLYSPYHPHNQPQFAQLARVLKDIRALNVELTGFLTVRSPNCQDNDYLWRQEFKFVLDKDATFTVFSMFDTYPWMFYGLATLIHDHMEGANFIHDNVGGAKLLHDHLNDGKMLVPKEGLFGRGLRYTNSDLLWED